ncbi:MAG: FbpB family small basic protein [Bacilli bacterium]
MRKKGRQTYQSLVEANKKQLLDDVHAIKEIDRKIEERNAQTEVVVEKK